jgi:O-antigen/teichoic acid export membrane protein
LTIKNIFKTKLIKNFFIYAFGAILLKGISVIIAPIIMRILTPADYGFLALVTNFIDIVFTIAGLGLRQLLTIEYFHYDIIDRKKLVNDIVSIYSVLMFPVFLILILGRDFINNFIFSSQAYSSLIIFCLLVAFLKFFSEIFYQILQYSGESFKLVFIQIFAALIIFSLNLSFLYFLGWGVFSVIAAQFVSVACVILVAIFFYIRDSYHVKFDLSCSLSKSWWYIKRGFPFVPRVLFAWILAVGDRWVLAKYGTMADVGIYSVADMFGQLFQVVFVLPFTYAYIPYMMEKFADSMKISTQAGSLNSVGCMESEREGKCKNLAIDRKNLITMICVMLAIIFLVSIGLVIFRPLICIILPPQYYAALNYIWGLLIGYIFLFGTYFASIFLQFQKRVYFLLFALLVPAVFNVFLNILLVPKFGISGCVFATVISYILYFLITIIYNFHVKNRVR